MQQDIRNMLINELGKDSFLKGLNYETYYVRLNSYFNVDDGVEYSFRVMSQHTYTRYSVSITVRDRKLINYECECPQFNSWGTCKHVAACAIKYEDTLFPEPIDEYKQSLNILKIFDDKKLDTVKKEIKLDVEFDIYDDINYCFKIGETKTYYIKSKSKLESFKTAYKDGGEFQLAKNFTYDANKYFFNDSDKRIIDYIVNYEEDNRYSYYKPVSPFELKTRDFELLLTLLDNKPFVINKYLCVYEVKQGFPINLKLELNDDTYSLNLEELKNCTMLYDNKYSVYNNTLYILPDKYRKLLANMSSEKIDKIVFKKENVEMFKNGLLNTIKDNIEIDENIEDIIVVGKPDISLYFDIKDYVITCDIKLDYKGNIINYFDINDKIVRDTSSEDEVISDLNKYNFYVDEESKKIYITEIEDICNLMEEGFSYLLTKYKVFTTEKIDNIDIIKKTRVESNFSIGQDGIMSYSFNTDNIDLDELDNILLEINNKKKYYKLKNGNILRIDNNEELQELNNIVNDMDISVKDLKSGNVIVPKYRAFYLDSLKKNKYKSIKTNNKFDEFINNFKKYKNTKIVLDEDDKKILRNYQINGVKWLYTLYNCDLGGILADEMGLGKSLQTIVFIKQIIRKNKDAKVLIVVPTSLVYNWQKEFERFGSNIKYAIVYENKEKRKEIINDFDKYNVFITSYGLIRNDNDEYENKNFELCVIDEAQTIKNYQAGMTKEIKKIKARTKIALTGTPIENSVLELWSIFDFIMPGYLNNVTKFRQKYSIKDVDDDSLNKLANLNYQIKPFILRRKKNEVIKDLPDKIEQIEYLQLPDSQKKVYLKVLSDTKKEAEKLIAEQGFKKAQFEILKLLTRLRQICIDPCVLIPSYEGESIKIDRLKKIVEDYIKDGHKILIFSSFKQVLIRVKTLFDENSISSYMIYGDVSAKERIKMVDAFNKDDTNCFLITLKSGGTGLNLTGADIVIHLDIWWNPQAENQATDRAHRIGQKNKVTVIKLVTEGTVEEKIIELQNKKKILADNLIEGHSKETLSSLDEKDLENLLSIGNE